MRDSLSLQIGVELLLTALAVGAALVAYGILTDMALVLGFLTAVFAGGVDTIPAACL